MRTYGQAAVEGRGYKPVGQPGDFTYQPYWSGLGRGGGGSGTVTIGEVITVSKIRGSAIGITGVAGSFYWTLAQPLLAALSKEKAMGTSYSRKLLITGIVIGAVSALFALFSPAVLIDLGATVEQNYLYTIAGAISRILVFFGLPFSAGLICLSLLLSKSATTELAQRMREHDRIAQQENLRQ